MDKLANRILEVLRREKLYKEGVPIIVAFSGGEDSTALLDIMMKISPILRFPVYAMHINHGLRAEEADRDEMFCRSFCKKRNIEFFFEKIDVMSFVKESKMSVEEQARILRYEALNRAGRILSQRGGQSKGGSFYIATGHHAGDQAETILMNMFRGSGLSGLSGMKYRRENIIRPFLEIGKKQILDYISRNNLEYVTDSTNYDTKWTRNYLRQSIFPLLCEHINSKTTEHVAGAGLICAEADEYIADEARDYLKKNADCGSDYIALPKKDLAAKKPIFRRYVIREMIKSLNISLKDWGECHLCDTDSAFFAGSGYHIDLPGKVFVESEKENVRLKKQGK